MIELKGYTLISVKIHRWTGLKSLKDEHLGIKFSKTLGSLGSFSVSDPEDLKKFNIIESRVLTLLSKYGLMFGNRNTFFIPNCKVKEVKSAIEKYRDEFYQLKKIVIHQYPVSLQRWADIAEKHQSGFGEIVLKNAYTLEYIDKQISFEILDYDSMVDNLSYNFLDEIAEVYQNKQKALIIKKEKDCDGLLEITRRDFIVLTNTYRRCCANSLLDESILPIIELLERFFKLADYNPDSEEIGTKGRIPQEVQDEYMKIISILSTVEGIQLQIITQNQQLEKLQKEKEIIDSVLNKFSNDKEVATENAKAVVKTEEKANTFESVEQSELLDLSSIEFDFNF